LKSALIYGANASGKTNFVKALICMRNMVLRSVVDKEPIKRIEPFKFSADSDGEPTQFEVAFLLEDSLYRYGFELFKGQINKEWLFKKVSRNTPVFYRGGSDWETIKLHGEMKDAEGIKKHTRRDSLFISTAALLNIELADKILKWFSSLAIFTLERWSPGFTIDYLEGGEERKSNVLKYLKKADIGIEDFDIQIKDMKLDESMKEALIPTGLLPHKEFLTVDVKRREVDIRTRHSVYGANMKVVDRIELPFLKYQSQGTIKFFELLGPILNCLEQGNVLVVDEIDARLHCSIVRFILSLFNSIDKNPRNAQLICNTHDVLILEEEIRRDQIWFVQKNSYGESELYSLNDFKKHRP
jgi:AAA15 family ATPase/GTPase